MLISLWSCQQKKFEQKEITKIDSTSKDHNTSEENIEVDSKKFIVTDWFKIFKTDTIIASEIYWKKIIEKDSLVKIFKADFINSPPLKDKTVKVLWNKRIDGELLNKEYFKTMSEPERAALGYIVKLQQILENGGEKYTIENTLNLGYPCLEKYKCYMQLWFRNDTESLKTIVDCFLWYERGQSVYDFLNEINLTVKGSKIYISFEIVTTNRDIWDCSRREEIIFLVDEDNIKVIDWKRQSPQNYTYVYYYPNGSDRLPPAGYKNDGTGTYRLVKKTKK